MSYLLDFPVRAGDPSPLNRIADAVRQVADKTKISSGEMKLWTDYVRKGVEEGFNLNRVLSQAEQAFGKASGGLSKFTTILRDHIREQQQLERQTQQTERAFARMSTYFSTGQLGVGGALPFGARGSIASMLPGGMAGVGVAAGVGGLLLAANEIRSITNEAANYGREITNLSMKTGLTIQETQLFSRAAEITGTNINGLVMQVRQLSKALVENSDEGRRAKGALAELFGGNSATVNQLPFMAPGQALQTIYGRLGGVQNPFEQRRIAATLFGRQGLEALPFSQEIARGGGDIRGAGGIFSDEDIRRAADYKRETELLSIQYEALKTQLGLSLIPAISTVVSMLRGILPGGPSTPTFSLFGGGTTRFGTRAPGATTGMFDTDFNRQFSEANTFFRALNPRLAPPGAPSAETLRLPFEQTNSQEIQRYLMTTGGDTREGKAGALQRQERQAQLDLSSAIDRNDFSAVKSANEKVIAIKRQLEALKSVEEITKRIADLEFNSTLRKFQGPFGAINAQRAIGLRQIQQAPGLSAGQISGFSAQLSSVFGNEIVLQAQEEFKRVGLEAYKEEEAARGRESKFTGQQYLEQLRSAARADEEIRKIGIGEQAGEFTRTAARADRFATLTMDRQPGAAAVAAYQSRITLAQQLREIEVSSAKTLGDEDQKRVALAKAEADFRKAGAEAQLDLEAKVLEIRQKERKEIENIAAGGFQALVSGGGRGLGQFARSQATGLGSRIVGNAAGMAWNALGLSTHMQVGGMLGGLLAGTAFGADPTSNLKISTDANTQATNLNTQALVALATGAGFGGSVGAATGMGGVSGTPGSIFGGATNNPFIFNNQQSSSSLSKALSGFGTNFGLGATNPLAVLFGGSVPTGPGSATTGAALGIAGTIGAVAGLAGAGFGIFQGAQKIGRGGGGGIASGISEIAGSAALIDPEPISKAVLAGVAVASGIAAAIFGDPKAARARQETRRLLSDQFYTPTPINTLMDVSGSAAGYDRFGNVRVAAGVSPYPQIQEPYYDFRHHVLVPGRSLGLGAPGPGAPPTIIIQAMDSESFTSAAKRNAHGIMDGVMHAVQTLGRHDLVEALRPQMG